MPLTTFVTATPAVATDVNNNFDIVYRKNALPLLTYGENVSAGNAVIIAGDSNSQTTLGGTNGGEALATSSYWAGGKFTTPAGHNDGVTQIIIYMWNGGSGAYSGVEVTCSIRADSGGSPSGADIGGITQVDTHNIPGGNSYVQYTFNFSTPVPVSASTTYWAVWRVTAGYNSNVQFAGNGSVVGTKKSTDGGSTWGATHTVEFYMLSTVAITTAGKVYKSTALSNNAFANNFVGFSEATVTAGNTGTVITGGVFDGLTGLTVGSTYYLSDTLGAISASAGSQSRKIGLAVSTTSLLIKHDNS